MTNNSFAERYTGSDKEPDNVQDLLVQIGFICLACPNGACGGSEQEMFECQSIHKQFGWKVDLLQEALILDEVMH